MLVSSNAGDDEPILTNFERAAILRSNNASALNAKIGGTALGVYGRAKSRDHSDQRTSIGPKQHPYTSDLLYEEQQRMIATEQLQGETMRGDSIDEMHSSFDA